MKIISAKSTKSLYFAAALLALGAEFVGADKSDPKNMEFHFNARKPNSETLQSIGGMELQNLDFLETQWVNKTLVVNAVEYSDAIKRMKSLVHSY